MRTQMRRELRIELRQELMEHLGHTLSKDTKVFDISGEPSGSDVSSNETTDELCPRLNRKDSCLTIWKMPPGLPETKAPATAEAPSINEQGSSIHGGAAEKEAKAPAAAAEKEAKTPAVVTEQEARAPATTAKQSLEKHRDVASLQEEFSSSTRKVFHD